jgi:carbon-monoxide dehydrogenase small subunit
MLAASILERDPDIGEDALKDALTSNLCRCTGYVGIVAAIKSAQAVMKKGG